MRTAIVGFVLIFITGVIIAYNMILSDQELEVINPVQINDSLVEGDLKHVMSGHRIGDFELINQDGVPLTAKAFEGKIYVADFFFTTCPGICKAMATQMERVQEANLGKTDFGILSHTVQPEVDSPAVLKQYATMHNADPAIWQFATGSRSEINRLARRMYFAARLEGSEDAMVHTENFVLVDKEKRIRGIYDGTSAEEVDKLISDIEILRRSYE